MEQKDIEEQLIRMDDLKEFSVGSGIDVSEHEGKKIRIAGAEIIDSVTSYDESGNKVDGLQRKIKKLKVFSEPVAVIKGKDGKDIKILASELFNLKLVNGEWGVSTSEKANINKFLKKLKLPEGLKGVRQLGGQSIIVKVTPNGFLGFVY